MGAAARCGEPGPPTPPDMADEEAICALGDAAPPKPRGAAAMAAPVTLPGTLAEKSENSSVSSPRNGATAPTATSSSPSTAPAPAPAPAPSPPPNAAPRAPAPPAPAPPAGGTEPTASTEPPRPPPVVETTENAPPCSAGTLLRPSHSSTRRPRLSAHTPCETQAAYTE